MVWYDGLGMERVRQIFKKILTVSLVFPVPLPLPFPFWSTLSFPLFVLLHSPFHFSVHFWLHFQLTSFLSYLSKYSTFPLPSFSFRFLCLASLLFIWKRAEITSPNNCTKVNPHLDMYFETPPVVEKKTCESFFANLKPKKQPIFCLWAPAPCLC